MLKQADGNDPSNGHLTMNNRKWATGVAFSESRMEKTHETVVCI